MTLTPDTWEYRLLTRIADAGGSIDWLDLTKGDTQRATRLSKQGWCAWSKPFSPRADGLDRKLHITPKGLAAIGRNAA